jgi:hypothetical protein
MQYHKPFHLFNSSGRWIGFCLANNVFDIDAVWRGWFPWSDQAEVLSPHGTYLGTVVGNRLYAFSHKEGVRMTYRPSFPAVPSLANHPTPIAPKPLPVGASDVELKYALKFSSTRRMRAAETDLVTASVPLESDLARKMPVRIRQNAAVAGCQCVGAIG